LTGTGEAERRPLPAAPPYQRCEAPAARAHRLREQAAGARRGAQHGHLLGLRGVRLLRADHLRPPGIDAGLRWPDAGRAIKNPFWDFLFFFVFFLFLGFFAFLIFLHIFSQKREFFGVFQFQEYFTVHPDFKL
jgi:hypothetical protein